MASDYPGALDTFSNPTSSTPMNDGTTPHAAQHADANDAIEAIQATLGVDPQGSESTVADRIAALEGGGGGGGGGGGLVLVYSDTFSAASAVHVDDCFTTDYDAYRIIVSALAASGSPNVTLNMRASGTDNTSTNYHYQISIASNASTYPIRATSQNTMQLGRADAVTGLMVSDIFGPALATQTQVMGMYAQGTTSAEITNLFGVHDVASAYDGFTLTPASSTITGSVYVYGYAK